MQARFIHAPQITAIGHFVGAIWRLLLAGVPLFKPSLYPIKAAEEENLAGKEVVLESRLLRLCWIGAHGCWDTLMCSVFFFLFSVFSFGTWFIASS